MWKIYNYLATLSRGGIINILHRQLNIKQSYQSTAICSHLVIDFDCSIALCGAVTSKAIIYLNRMTNRTRKVLPSDLSD